MKSPRERRVSRGGFANAGIHIQVNNLCQNHQQQHYQYHDTKERRERDREERPEVSSDGKSILIQDEDGEMVCHIFSHILIS